MKTKAQIEEEINRLHHYSEDLFAGPVSDRAEAVTIEARIEALEWVLEPD